MKKKFIILLMIAFVQTLFAGEEKLSIPFYKESNHFKIYCLESDKTIADETIQILQEFCYRWIIDFSKLNESYFFTDEKISIYIYPNIQDFQKYVLKDLSSPNWMIGIDGSNYYGISVVSANNPGQSHTKESTFNVCKAILGNILMNNYYKQTRFCDWISQGLVLYYADMYSMEFIQKYLSINNEIQINSVFKLNIDEINTRPLKISSYALTKFLIDNWGWDKALDIYEDYSKFESITGLSEEDFRNECTKYYQSLIYH